MLSAVGSSTSPNTTGTNQSAVALQAQLDRFQKQLSDCVNCSSAKTREGQKAIQDLSNKIGQVKTQINQFTATKQTTSNAIPTTGMNVNKNNLPPNLGQNINITA